MKMYNCKGCGKIITEEDIGFRDEEGNVFCKACALKLTVEEREEAPEEKPEVKEKKLKGFHIFLIVAGILLMAEVGLYLFNGMKPIESIPIEEVVAKMPDVPGKILLIDAGMQAYLSEHTSPPGDFSALFPDYIKKPEQLLYNGKMPVYQLSKKWGYLVYYVNEDGEIEEPVLTQYGLIPSEMMEGEK